MSTPLLLSLSLLLLTTATTAVNFNCTSTGSSATCRALVGYQPFSDTTYAQVQSLFQVPSLTSLLGANNLKTPVAIPGNSTVKVPIPCRCADGVGRSDRSPNYTVANGDGLFNIATYTFGNLLTYQEIALYNGLADPNKINVSEVLWIPLPCSCDLSEGGPAVHLAHRVAAKSTIESIATQFGVNASTILKVNGITDEKSLQADQILDVPLRACSSSINSSSPDYTTMRLAKDSYDITANECIQCSCSADTNLLNCYQTANSSRCTIPRCEGNLLIGNSTSSGCEKTTCSYAGYTNTSSTITVHVASTNQSTCASGVSSILDSRRTNWLAFVLFLQMAWLYML